MQSRPLILVVDDDGPIVTLMRSILWEFGFEPMTAMSGAEAIAAAQQRAPNLVLLDKNMPGMSGEEVIQAMRATPDLEEVPILILSGEPVDRDEMTRLGVRGAVMKPFDVRALVDQINLVLSAE